MFLSHNEDNLQFPELVITDEMTQDYKEKNIIHFFQESAAKSKESFFKSCSKPDSEVIILSYPIDLVFFHEKTQSCITLATQFLGLNTNVMLQSHC